MEQLDFIPDLEQYYVTMILKLLVEGATDCVFKDFESKLLMDQWYTKQQVPLVLSSYHKDIYKRMERLGVPNSF